MIFMYKCAHDCYIAIHVLYICLLLTYKSIATAYYKLCIYIHDVQMHILVTFEASTVGGCTDQRNKLSRRCIVTSGVGGGGMFNQEWQEDNRSWQTVAAAFV